MKSAGKIPAKWSWHHRALLRLRDKLLRERDEHNAEFRAPIEKGGADAVDVANEKLEHATLLAELASEEAELTAVDAALERIRNGTYGICTVSGKPISAARLRAVPWTPFSHEVALRRERARSLSHDFLRA